MLPLLIYIASPYNKGDKEANVRVQIDAAHCIMDLGHCPLVPNLSHYMELVRPRPYQEWMQRDFSIIKRCDMLLRLPGYSPGADAEVSLALSLGMHVVHSLNELVDALELRKKTNQ